MGDRGFGRILKINQLTFTQSVNMKADKQLEVKLGSDRVVRINVDGVCVMRIQCDSSAEIRYDTPVELLVIDGQLIMK